MELLNYKLVRQPGLPGRTAVLPETWQKAEKSIQNVSFGKYTAEVVSISFHEHSLEIGLSENLWNELCIPFEAHMRAAAVKGCLRLGPLVGILAEGFQPDSSSYSSFFENYLDAGVEAGCLPFIFSYRNVQPDSRRINGWFLNSGQWVQQEVPLPDVVYNKLPDRKTEQSKQYRRTLSWLREQGKTSVFNPSFFDKGTVHEHLFQDADCRVYLPETHFNPSLETFIEMAGKYEELFVKPAEGSLGKGVVCITKKSTGFYCRAQQKDSVSAHTYHSAERLYRALLGTKPALLQQGIDLVQIRGRRTDFRFHTNKNSSGQWEVSAAAVKICGESVVTTHTGNGGEVISFSEFSGNQDAGANLVKEIGKAALVLSRCLDKRLPGPIGEIGFDFGLDRKGRVWLFEANAKPGRGIFDHPLLSSQKKRTLQLPFQYALYLAGFTGSGQPRRDKWLMNVKREHKTK
ncbi:YheC/YheD family protein [Fictibacillus aquaticus]|uniref:ATP-grasp domain-containing protein n=1 Tax=Fictibacillus aquaticus TaxID=2021314 RepID=A0A235F749_9BACL|nr:YheC/YheD family protein [Fictibacillus aquaticus]OYD56853.1 hypothetical protein CGZ90_14965 [Fictibacillus aquaticus]